MIKPQSSQRTQSNAIQQGYSPGLPLNGFFLVRIEEAQPLTFSVLSVLSVVQFPLRLLDNFHGLSRTEPFIASGNHQHTGFYGAFDFYHAI